MGAAERTIGQLKQMLRHFINPTHTNWQELLLPIQQVAPARVSVMQTKNRGVPRATEEEDWRTLASKLRPFYSHAFKLLPGLRRDGDGLRVAVEVLKCRSNC